MVAIHAAPTRELDAGTLHDVLRLRQDVFVLEQECLYPDLDGRDLDPGTVQVWAEDEEGRVVATLRILADGAPCASAGSRRRCPPATGASPRR